MADGSVPVLLVGAGARHARVLSESPRARLAGIVDPDDRGRSLARDHGVPWACELDDAPDHRAAIVATPTATHLELAVRLLDVGTPALVEKPIAEHPDDVRTILAASERTGAPVTCGLVERFNPVVRTARDLLDEAPIHVVTMRHSPPNPRITTSVVFDLLIHDVDMVLGFCDGELRSVSGAGWRPEPWKPAEIADATLAMDDGAVATVSANRWAQRKVRTVSISTSSTLVELDLVRHDITVYRHVRHELVRETYRAETVVDIPFVRDSGEPLKLQLDAFLDLVEGRADPAEERSTLLAPHEAAAAIEAAISEVTG